MTCESTPFYDPSVSYEANYSNGPFGTFAEHTSVSEEQEPQADFLGYKVHVPFGIPAGPLVNAKFVAAAFNYGYDLCVYKTVRSRQYPCHPWPNVLAVHEDRLEVNRAEPVVADQDYRQPLSITNSFGVPSANPDVWQPDMARAVKAARSGQVLIGSFQGTNDGRGKAEFIRDCVHTAKLVIETGAPVVELNTSCPNEGTSNLMCHDNSMMEAVTCALKEVLGSVPLIIKIAYFREPTQLEQLVRRVGRYVDGIAAINTITAAVVDENGNQALPGQGRERSGICGNAIKWAGLEMTQQLYQFRQELGLNYAIIGVGGVMSVQDFLAYQHAGADAAMSATGAMWNPLLARQIRRQ